MDSTAKPFCYDSPLVKAIPLNERDITMKIIGSMTAAAMIMIGGVSVAFAGGHSGGATITVTGSTGSLSFPRPRMECPVQPASSYLPSERECMAATFVASSCATAASQTRTAVCFLSLVLLGFLLSSRIFLLA